MITNFVIPLKYQNYENAIDYLEENPDKIDCDCIWSNPNCIRIKVKCGPFIRKAY